MIERARKRLSKRAKKGFRGWPLATVALYGPDDMTASKLTVGIVPADGADVTDLRRWLSKDQTDNRVLRLLDTQPPRFRDFEPAVFRLPFENVAGFVPCLRQISTVLAPASAHAERHDLLLSEP